MEVNQLYSLFWSKFALPCPGTATEARPVLHPIQTSMTKQPRPPRSSRLGWPLKHAGSPAVDTGCSGAVLHLQLLFSLVPHTQHDHYIRLLVVAVAYNMAVRTKSDNGLALCRPVGHRPVDRRMQEDFLQLIGHRMVCFACRPTAHRCKRVNHPLRVGVGVDRQAYFSHHACGMGRSIPIVELRCGTKEGPFDPRYPQKRGRLFRKRPLSCAMEAARSAAQWCSITGSRAARRPRRGR